ncbi:hypothetical protein HPB50_009729 [Hyalomma asiaticum]|uniref:Uncharacterized protein n=1 Tax=Hyalomma asiaticum TaxID=266040 RepID=A0ACB7THW9_HYAAI|nr:hypothetical protein HPB50_009729 [Hyalomma asiaticum]
MSSDLLEALMPSRVHCITIACSIRRQYPLGARCGPLFKLFRAVSSLYHAAASAGEAGGLHRTDADPMEGTQAEGRGYDPDNHIRRLGTSNNVRLTFSGKVKPRHVHYDALLIPVQQYKKTVPACGLCGSIGHRSDACPGPKPDICGLCGSAAALVDGMRAPHECAPRCSLCAGPHVTGDRTCKARYREPRPPPKAVPSGPRSQGKKKKKSKEKNRSTKDGTSSTNLTQLRPPQPGAGAGGPEHRDPTQDGPPSRVTTEKNGGPENSNSAKTPNGSRPAAKGDQGSWTSRVHHGPQVSSQSRVAPSLSPSPASQPNTPPLNLSREQLEITKLREQAAFLTQKLASAELSQARPHTPNTQAAEEMESTPLNKGCKSRDQPLLKRG